MNNSLAAATIVVPSHYSVKGILPRERSRRRSATVAIVGCCLVACIGRRCLATKLKEMSIDSSILLVVHGAVVRVVASVGSSHCCCWHHGDTTNK